MEQDAVTSAIDRLYSVFAGYPRPTALRGADSRDPEKLLRDLTSAPLREASPDAIGSFCGWVITTIFDDENAFRHFLPRILELALRNTLGREPELLAGKLVMARWREWPQVEQEVVEVSVLTAWKASLAQPTDQINPENWLVAGLIIGMAPEDFTKAWLEAPLREGMLHLADYVDLEKDDLKTKGFPDGPWMDGAAVEPRRKLAAWLLSPQVRERLGEAAILKDLQKSELYILAYAIGVLDVLRPAET